MRFARKLKQHFKKAREENSNVNVDEDFKSQQELYQKFSGVYDEYLEQEETATHRWRNVCEEVVGVISDNKAQATLLDYGCGTGPMAELLVKEYGFKTVDGLEPNQGLLEVARKKRVYEKAVPNREQRRSIPARRKTVRCSLSRLACSLYRRHILICRA